MNVTKWYRCHNCMRLHDSIDYAQNCCELDIHFKCGECGNFHDDKEKAVICCDVNEPEKLKEQLTLRGLC